MYRAKKMALVFTSLVLLIASLCQAASAIEISPRASDYLSNYGASLYQGEASGSVSVSGTKKSDLIGVSKISIYKGDGTFITSVTGTVANGLLAKDLKTHAGDYTYYGEANELYYMVLTMYAKRDGGSDSRLYTTNLCRG